MLSFSRLHFGRSSAGDCNGNAPDRVRCRGEGDAQMTMQPIQVGKQPLNPLDILEELVAANEWAFDRSSDDEMVVETAGQWCDYRMYFVWREDLNARSEEHTSAPVTNAHLVCRLLLENKKTTSEVKTEYET